jgi:hypothetical protein
MELVAPITMLLIHKVNNQRQGDTPNLSNCMGGFGLEWS